MPYVAGEGFKMGLALGQAQDEHKKNQAYLKDRERALLEHEQDRKKALVAEEANRQAGDLELERLGEKAVDAADELPTGAAGPLTAGAQREVTGIKAHVARVRDIASRMSPENREQYVGEQKALLAEEATNRVRQKVAAGIQDRRAHGAYNFLDETEPNPAIEAQLDKLGEALDTPGTDPLKVAEAEAMLLATVRKENESRLLRRAVTENLDAELKAAQAAGNAALSSDIRSLVAAWGTHELTPEDVVDKLFEAKHGRKTARASEPTPFDIRKEAMKLWQAYEKGPPTEEGLQKYIDMLDPPPPRSFPAPSRQEAIEAITGMSGGGGPGGVPAPGSAPIAGPPEAPAAEAPAAPPEAAPAAEAPATPPAEEAGETSPTSPEGPTAEEAAPEGAAAEQPEPAGAPRLWAALKLAERRGAERTLLATAKNGGDLRAMLRALRLDEESLPGPLWDRVMKFARESGKTATPTGVEYEGAGLP